MGMFSNSLIQGLINPSFGDSLSQVGMLAGSYDRRRREKQEEDAKKLKEAQIASMQATAQGATEEAARKREMAQQVLTKQVASAQDPGIAAAAQAGAMRAGVKPTDVKAAAGMATERTKKTKRDQGIETVTQIVSRSDVSNPNVQRAIQQVALNYGLTKDDLAMVLLTATKGSTQVIKRDVNGVPTNILVDKTTGADIADLGAAPATGKGGTSGKVTTKEIYDPVQQRNVIAQLDAQGNIVGTLEPPRTGPESWSVDADKEYRRIVDETMKAQAVVNSISNIEQDLQDAAFYERGVLGSTLGSVRGAAGISNTIDTAFADARALRVSNILQYLPPGVASDKDVELVLTTQIDPRNLSNEERQSWLNGYKKLKEQEVLFNQRRAEWMTQNGGSQGGFLQKETQLKAESDINFFRRQRPNDFNNFVQVIREVEQMPEGSQERLLVEQRLQEKAELLKGETKIDILQAIRNYQRIYNEN
jgi:hypothetical protein